MPWEGPPIILEFYLDYARLDTEFLIKGMTWKCFISPLRQFRLIVCMEEPKIRPLADFFRSSIRLDSPCAK